MSTPTITFDPVAHEAAKDAVTDALNGALDCTRVWEAWSIGTMGEDDFAEVASDPDRVAEITDAALTAYITHAPAAVIADPAEALAATLLDLHIQLASLDIADHPEKEAIELAYARERGRRNLGMGEV